MKTNLQLQLNRSYGSIELNQQLWLIRNKPVIVLGDPSMIGLPSKSQNPKSKACACFVSENRVKPTSPCAFFIATWPSSLSDPMRAFDLTHLSLPLEFIDSAVKKHEIGSELWTTLNTISTSQHTTNQEQMLQLLYSQLSFETKARVAKMALRLVIRSMTITVDKDLKTWTRHEPILDTQIHSLEQPQEFLNLLILIGELILITQTSEIAFAHFIAILMDIRLQGKMEA
ncbi:hypothetical protein Tco_0881558 [Tanacetum coccineum]